MKKRLLYLVLILSAIRGCNKMNGLVELTDRQSPAGYGDQYAFNSITSSGPRRVLFDAKHGQTAGNDDWIIDQDNNIPQRTPTPLQSSITATTSENYWTGGISAWGIALVKLGLQVETIPSTGSMAFGNTTNAQDLANYDVLVIDEPNIRFTTAEKTAVLNFVKSGGGLFMIANHSGSDRNSDGWDAPAIWNDLMSSNSVQANPFGIRYDLLNFSETSSNVATTVNPLTNGSQGKVTSLKYSSGSSMTLTSGSAARGVIWRTGTSQGLTRVMAAYSTYGNGKIVAMCDSSPSDDGTGAPNNTLYKGWTDLSGNHSRLHLNATLWLARL